MREENFDINENDYDNFDIKNNNLQLITIVCLLSALFVNVIHNIDMDQYIRDIIIPFGFMIGSYIIIINKIKIYKNSKAYIFLLPIMLILISKLIVKIDESNMVLNILILPILISMFLFSSVNKHYNISRSIFKWVFNLFPKNVFGNLKYIRIQG